jgi:hypothetical protein
MLTAHSFEQGVASLPVTPNSKMDVSAALLPNDEWESIYLMHFQRALSEVLQRREDYRFLFTEVERRLADPFLQAPEIAPIENTPPVSVPMQTISKSLSRAARYCFIPISNFLTSVFLMP